MTTNADLTNGVISNLLDQVDDLKAQVAAVGGGPIPPPPAGLTVPSVEWEGGTPKEQDFIKGWPSQDMFTPHLRRSLAQSFTKAMTSAERFLNYGDPANGAYMLGTPDFRQALASYLSAEYGKPVDWNCLMSTSGGSMGTDLCLRMHCKAGDYAVVEEPTYFLSHTMLRDRDMDTILGVPMESDGMDLVALEKLLVEHAGKIKAVYTVCVHHNPSGYTLSNAKRAKLIALAQKYDFYVIADEAYQLVGFSPLDEPVAPLFYHDNPEDPRVFSVGTFSKVIGPGLKVGWVQAYPPLLAKLKNVGWIDSGNNPVIMSSAMIIDFIKSGNLKLHSDFVNRELGKKCALMCAKLRDVGITDFYEPKGGYFVWVKAKGKKTGKSGEPCSIKRDKFGDYMRLCFAWLQPEQIIEGIECLRE